MNCWEHQKCGREQGGAKALELGVCPTALRRAGDACWLIAGTFCGGEVQGTFAQKQINCMNCNFYKLHDLAHRARVRAMWLTGG